MLEFGFLIVDFQFGYIHVSPSMRNLVNNSVIWIVHPWWKKFYLNVTLSWYRSCTNATHIILIQKHINPDCAVQLIMMLYYSTRPVNVFLVCTFYNYEFKDAQEKIEISF